MTPCSTLNSASSLVLARNACNDHTGLQASTRSSTTLDSSVTILMEVTGVGDDVVWSPTIRPKSYRPKKGYIHVYTRRSTRIYNKKKLVWIFVAGYYTLLHDSSDHKLGVHSTTSPGFEGSSH